MSNIINPTILPYKCEESLVRLGNSCELQKEIYDNLYKLQTGEAELAPNSVAIGSGLGDASWNEAINYEENQKALSEKLSQEAKQEAENNIATLVDKNKIKDSYLYIISILLVAGVLIYEFKNKK